MQRKMANCGTPSLRTGVALLRPANVLGDRWPFCDAICVRKVRSAGVSPAVFV
jgi:hypothetical protein